MKPINKTSIPATIRGNVYKYQVQNSYTYTHFFDMAVLYDQTLDPQEKSIALNALSFTRLIWLLDFLCYDLMQPMSTIRPQDFFTLTIAMSRNPSGRHIAWYFLRHRWYDIIAKYVLTNCFILISFQLEYLWTFLFVIKIRTEQSNPSQRSQKHGGDIRERVLIRGGFFCRFFSSMYSN